MTGHLFTKMKSAPNFIATIGFFMLATLIDANINPSDRTGHHVTPSMASMANIKDNKTTHEERKRDSISISISPTPNWSSPQPLFTINLTTDAKSSAPLFGSIVTKTSSLPQKALEPRGHHQPESRTSDTAIDSNILHKRNAASSSESVGEVKRSADEFQFQIEPPDPPVSLASSSTRITGPYFESNKTTVYVTARAGQNVMFDCVVVLLQGRTVSWLRRKKDNLQLLTVGNATYHSDPRVGLRFRYPNNWRLGIDSVNKLDEGEYQCQLSTHPPKALIFHLKVIAPAVQILDENGHIVTERHYKVDSSLHLTCKASHVDKSLDGIVWLKGDRPLPGGESSRIKVRPTKTQNGEAIGYLSVLSVRKGDSGNYTCRASPFASATIAVHVLNGELHQAVQHENSSNSVFPLSLLAWALSPFSILISTLFSTTLHMGSQHPFLS